MNPVITIVLVSLIAFLGQVIGNLLAKISPEEMKPGKKYFLFFEVFFIAVTVILGLVLFFKFNFVNILLVVIGIIIGLFFRRIYAYLGGLLFTLSSGYLFVFSSLIFIYGLFYGTLERPFKHLRSLVFDCILFFAVGLFVIFISFDLSGFFDFDLINFFIGGLISQIYVKIKFHK